MRLAVFTLSMIIAVSAFADDLELSDEEVIGTNVLSESRGGRLVEIEIDSIYSDTDMTGISSDNLALNTVSGNNILAPGAFAGSSGISSVIQNTGNNVVIQNATVVNLTLK
ncbi:carbon storage regulator [Vibrio sp. STUT-A11]|uniref:carbon storage regulator n=1 Tax=Vibrio sp. STUT-A11 TaxID=2976236 RepID=UPI00222F2BA2|nr:carbon storage regulator [Vibrio sp. STUT-A11]BDR12470.1 hypothetical protein VspSTUT11_04460 [Vibrio sp. STUT-A11]